MLNTNDFHELHQIDPDGNPTGGVTHGRGFSICWQNGPLGRGDERVRPNGAFVEDVIRAAIGRLKHYQASPFECEENVTAIQHLQDALFVLAARTRDRETRGVEGTHGV